jgi:hypothetical protein
VLNVDFTYSIADSNYTVPARILLFNKTSGSALFYKWSFTNANISEYNQREPGELIITKPGAVIIKLEAWNDDERKEKIVNITLDSITVANFTATPRLNNIVPAEFDFQFTGQGATNFSWSFDGASTTGSTLRNPSAIAFSNPGQYKVFLQAKNNRGKSDTITKWISVRPPLSASFDIEPSFDDDDYEAPLLATLSNHSTSVTQHQWSAPGGLVSNASDSTPTVTFLNAGTYTVTYTASNGKQTSVITRNIQVKPNSGLRSFTNIKLGINTAHPVVGSFFSTKLRKTIPRDSVSSFNGPLIDICFFGLSSSFNYNKFVTPDSVQQYTFSSIPGATNTLLINKQESCSCIGMTASDFDNLVSGSAFDNLSFTNTAASNADFNSGMVPRVVLFKNNDGKKGAIKIQQYVNAGNSSYIICDIKIQKE